MSTGRKPFAASVYTAFKNDIAELTTLHQDANARLDKNRRDTKALLKQMTRLNQRQKHPGEKLRGGAKTLSKRTLREYVLHALQRAGKAITTSEIYDSVVRLGWVTTSRTPYQNVATTLHHLTQERPLKISRISRGMYAYGAKAPRYKQAANA